MKEPHSLTLKVYCKPAFWIKQQGEHSLHCPSAWRNLFEDALCFLAHVSLSSTRGKMLRTPVDGKREGRGGARCPQFDPSIRGILLSASEHLGIGEEAQISWRVLGLLPLLHFLCLLHPLGHWGLASVPPLLRKPQWPSHCMCSNPFRSLSSWTFRTPPALPLPAGSLLPLVSKPSCSPAFSLCLSWIASLSPFHGFFLLLVHMF